MRWLRLGGGYLHMVFITYISRIPNCKVVTVAKNGFQFLQYCANNTLPHIAIMDIEMPIMDGISCTDYATIYYATMAIIALSSHTPPRSSRRHAGLWGKGLCI